MKKVEAKLKPIHLNWLPAPETWDFRSITRSECHLACHWEYERENHPVTSSPAEHYKVNAAIKTTTTEVPYNLKPKYWPANYYREARELFPQPWMTLTQEERKKVMATFLPRPVLQVRKLGEFLKRIPVQGTNPEIRERFMDHSYVMIPNFQTYGVEAVKKALNKWASDTSKHYLASHLKQAAELPFNALKWLAIARLDEARCRAKITIEKARGDVKAYLLAHGLDSSIDVYPVYNSDGSWSKAKSDSIRFQSKILLKSDGLLSKLS